MSLPLPHLRLKYKVKSCVASGKISLLIIDARVRKFIYLQDAFKKGLRLMPPVTGIIFESCT